MSLKRKPPAGNVRRVRHVGGSTGKNIPGNFTNKAGRRVQFKSHTAEIVMRSLDRQHSVKDYESQPEIFGYFDEFGKRHTHVPDLKLTRVDGTIEIHEVTIASRRTEPNVQRCEQAMQRICRSRGWKYVVHTEENLPGETEQVNLRVLQGYRGQANYNAAIAQVTKELLPKGQTSHLRHLARAVAAHCGVVYPAVINTLGYMLWHDELVFDISGVLLLIDGAINPAVLVWFDV